MNLDQYQRYQSNGAEEFVKFGGSQLMKQLMQLKGGKVILSPKSVDEGQFKMMRRGATEE